MLFVSGCRCNVSTPKAAIDDEILIEPTRSKYDHARIAPSTQPAPYVPTVYYTRLNPITMTEAQFTEVLAIAKARAPANRRVWFILVRSNWEYDGELQLGATVHYSPDVSGARLRKGKCTSMGIGPFTTKMEALLRKLETEGLAEPGNEGSDALSDYWQVSLRDQPFNETLGVPRGTLLPFDPPEGLPDDEVIEILDYLRTCPPQPQQPGSFAFPERFDGDAPIRSIERRDGGIEVRSGTQEGLLSGHGESVRLVKKQDGFHVESIGNWNS